MLFMLRASTDDLNACFLFEVFMLVLQCTMFYLFFFPVLNNILEMMLPQRSVHKPNFLNVQ